jgi:type-F conjugative transfer system pilin assembly protein TrbC
VVTVRIQLVVLVIALFVPIQHAFAKMVLIETPNLCAHVEKVDANRVYLTEAGEPCPIEGPSKANIQISEETIEIDVYVNGTHWRKLPASSQSFSIGDIADVVAEAKKNVERLTIPENPHATEALRTAEDLSRYFQSGKLQEIVESEKARLYGEIYGSETDNHHEATKASEKTEWLSPQERIYLFISSSVPLPTLRHYVQVISSLGERNIRIVMRGFVDGARFVKPTMAFLKEILVVDPECNLGPERCNTYGSQVIIDPPLFGRYHVEKVPAFVYVPSVSVADNQMSEGPESNSKISDYYLVYGDVSLEYALRLFTREKRSPGLEGLLARCQGE